MWVDGTRVGVSSDYYYLAATGPALGLITGSSDCDRTSHRVIVNHRPEFAAGEPGSPGDDVAHGKGTCTIGLLPMRWAVLRRRSRAWPGPPRSGSRAPVCTSSLAVMRDSPQAPHLLGMLCSKSTEFGGASVPELIEAARPIPTPILMAALASV